jgi:hypothetical protein
MSPEDAATVAQAIVRVFHLRPEQRYLLAIQRNTTSDEVIRQLGVLLKDLGIDGVILLTHDVHGLRVLPLP